MLMEASTLSGSSKIIIMIKMKSFRCCDTVLLVGTSEARSSCS